MKRDSELVGIAIDETRALAFLNGTVTPWIDEFRAQFPLDGQGDSFHLLNSVFMAVDAHVYYGLIRGLRPRRIIEIGAGRSTQIAAAAVKRNVADGGPKTDITAIEPVPPPYLPRDSVELRQENVQSVPLTVFAQLEAGDVLFIDSTHVLRAGGDVHYEYAEILPRLPAGVYVHIHDVSLPRAYPQVYFDSKLYWNEQYLLQALLTFNDRFEVLWPSAYMALNIQEMSERWCRSWRKCRAAFRPPNPQVSGCAQKQPESSREPFDG